jgi:hypothetical protein
MTKLEQVARAIQDKLLERHIVMLSVDAADAARAAVEALREPARCQTDALYDLRWKNINSDIVWQAMVDAILSEKPE